MKKHLVIIILMAAPFVGGALAATDLAPPSPEGSPGPRCRATGWSPEAYTNYGKKDTIIKKFAYIPTDLSTRRVFLQVTQGNSGGDVRLYEQQKDGTFSVKEWKPKQKQTSTLLASIDAKITFNLGKTCVGTEVEKLLTDELGPGTSMSAAPASVLPKQAFAPSLDEVSGGYIKTTVIILC
jgi:hypothetical protein